MEVARTALASGFRVREGEAIEVMRGEGEKATLLGSDFKV